MTAAQCGHCNLTIEALGVRVLTDDPHPPTPPRHAPETPRSSSKLYPSHIHVHFHGLGDEKRVAASCGFSWHVCLLWRVATMIVHPSWLERLDTVCVCVCVCVSVTWDLR